MHQSLDDQKDWFKIVDTNNDEKLSLEELRASFAAENLEVKNDPNEADATFALMDSNGDGVISIDEWLAFYMQAPQEPEYENGALTPEHLKHFRERFDLHDLDKSGSLDVAEFTALILEEDPEATAAHAKSWFSEMDIDKKGFISFEQWIAAADTDTVEATPLTLEQKSQAAAEAVLGKRDSK